MIPNCKKDLDFYYPIGTYYETSNKDFNPNKTWGGTWVRDTNGLVTVGAVDEVGADTWPSVQVTEGDTIGEAEHTLTLNEMPKHNHKFNRDNLAAMAGTGSYEIDQNTNGGRLYHLISIDNAGGDQPHNNVQPSIGVYRWHRIS